MTKAKRKIVKRPATRKNKYHARRSDDFDSDAEKDYSGILKLLKMAGEIKDYRHHPPPVLLFENPNGRDISWNIDFWVQQTDDVGYYVEVKGKPTRKLPEYYLKLRMYQAKPPAPLIVVEKVISTRFKIVIAVGCGEAGVLVKALTSLI